MAVTRLFHITPEAWDQYSEDNSMENKEDNNDSIGFYSPAGSEQFIAVHRPPTLKDNEAQMMSLSNHGKQGQMRLLKLP